MLIQRSAHRNDTDRDTNTIGSIVKAAPPEQVHRIATAAVADTGGPLPYREQIQRSFGHHDISQIQTHTGTKASQANRALSARAFTLGHHVALAGNPDLHTVAHEAAHVVQQRRGIRLSSGVGQVGDRYEQHADQVANRVRAGRSAQSLLDAVPGVAAGHSQKTVSRLGVEAAPVQRLDDKTSNPNVTSTVNTEAVTVGDDTAAENVEIHADDSQEAAQEGGSLALVSKNPALVIPFDHPSTAQRNAQISLPASSIENPGLRVDKVSFELKRKKLAHNGADRGKNKTYAFQLKSGTMNLAVEMDKLVTSEQSRTVELTRDKEAGLSLSAVYAEAKDKNSAGLFDNLGSKLNDILGDRVTTKANIVKGGVQAAIQVKEGELGSSGLVLKQSELAATASANGISLSGNIGLSDKEQRIKGNIAVGWSNGTLQIHGTAEVKDVINGLEPFAAKIGYKQAERGPHSLTLGVEQVAFARTFGTVLVTGAARDVRYDFTQGSFTGRAQLGAALPALGTLDADASIVANKLQKAAFSYSATPLQFPDTQPMFSGDLKSHIQYDDGKLSGTIDGNATLDMPALNRLAKNGRAIKMTVKASLAENGTIGAKLALPTPMELSRYFTVSKLNAEMDTQGKIALAGDLALESKLLDPAKLSVSYRDGAFRGSGTVGVRKDKIVGIDTANLSLTLTEDQIAAKGKLTPSLPQIREGNVEGSYSPDEGFAFGGTLTLGEIPYVKNGSVDFMVAKRPDDEAYQVQAAGLLAIAIPGLNTSAQVSYDDGAFTIEGTAQYQRGLANGKVTIGVTNRHVDEQGQISDQLGDTITPYGSGSVTLKLTPWLQGTAGIRLLPNGEIEVTGQLGITEAVTFFDQRKFKRELFAVGFDIPILGFAIARQRVGVFATVGGGAELDAQIGPGQLKQAKLGVTYNPDHPDQAKINGSAKLQIPAGAGITLSLHGALGAGIPVVSATLGLEASGRLGLQGALDAGVELAWSQADGLSFDASAAISAQPKFKFALKGFADVSADLLGYHKELYHKDWKLAEFEFGSDMRFGMKFPVYYDSKNGLQLAWDQVEFETPDIDTIELLKGLIDNVK